MNQDTSPVSTRPSDSLITTVHVVYGLHAVSVLIGATSIATATGDAAHCCEGKLRYMGESCFLMVAAQRAVGPELRQLLLQTVVATNGHGARKRKALCRGEILESRPCRHGYEHLVRYAPITPLSDYLIKQYFLNDSLAPRV